MSADAKHTPGPWIAKADQHHAQVSQVWGDSMTMVVCNVMAGLGDGRANARLIAAAPQLLAALQAVFRQTCILQRHPDDVCKATMAEALAKVEGRSLARGR